MRKETDIILKRFDRIFKNYKKKLSQVYSEKTTDQIAIRTLNEYELLLPKTPKFEGVINIFNWAIAENVKIVAFYKAMKEHDKTVEEAMRVLFEVTEDSYRSIPMLIRWFARKIVFSRAFFWIIRHSSEKVRDHPEGWKINYKKGDKVSNDWYFECTECGVIKYYKNHGAEELAPFCNYIDYLQSYIFCMGMQNPKNIGQGNEICIEYMKAGRDTLLPDNLKMFNK